jgi:hypothetical protein
MKPGSLERHSRRCKICRSRRREEIEQAFLRWVPQSEIARSFKLGNRLSIYRHMEACGFFDQRNANIKNFLAGFIERGSSLKPTPASLIAAVVALSRLDAQGRSVERIENATSLDAIFSRMTLAELRAYAETGTIPAWIAGDSNRTPDEQKIAQEPQND